MKIVLFGATRNVGQRILAEALSRGHQVVGVVRDPDKVQSPDARASLVQGDATDVASVAHVSHGGDAIVSAISPRPNMRGLAAPSLVSAARALIAGAGQSGVRRLVVVGGAGSLEGAPGKPIMDLPGFPDAFKPEAEAQRDALRVYRDEAAHLEWTYLSPAAEIHPGQRTAKYRTGNDTLVVDSAGKSTISFEDYAVALVDELERKQHVGRRFTVAY